jgi:acyl carrier protein
MAVVTVMTSIEDHFGIAIDDDEISADTFETVGSLTAFVDRKLNQ